MKTVGKEGPSEEERVMMEIKIFSLASHLFWGLWSIVNAKLSEIPFGYWVSSAYNVGGAGGDASQLTKSQDISSIS